MIMPFAAYGLVYLGISNMPKIISMAPDNIFIRLAQSDKYGGMMGK